MHDFMQLGVRDAEFPAPNRRRASDGEVFERIGALVSVRLYPGMPHTVNPDEIRTVNEMIKPLATQ